MARQVTSGPTVLGVYGQNIVRKTARMARCETAGTDVSQMNPKDFQNH